MEAKPIGVNYKVTRIYKTTGARQMTLLEILQKELTEFPKDMAYAVQDDDGEVTFGKHSPHMPREWGIWPRHEGGRYTIITGFELAEDRDSAIVTKAMWEDDRVTEKRKVRKDFDPKQSISVDVSGCTDAEKKEVRKAFFDVGIKWKSGMSGLGYLNARLYTNSTSEGTCYGHLMYGTVPRTDSISRQQFLSMVYEPVQQGHIYAHLMALYAEDAKATDRPWELWQVKTDSGEWRDLKCNPNFEARLGYRRKPKTRTVNGVEIPNISFTPSVGGMYYYPNPILYKWATDDLYREDCKFTRRLIELNLCYPFTDEGKQAAITHSKAMLGIA